MFASPLLECKVYVIIITSNFTCILRIERLVKSTSLSGLKMMDTVCGLSLGERVAETG